MAPDNKRPKTMQKRSPRAERAMPPRIKGFTVIPSHVQKVDDAGNVLATLWIYWVGSNASDHSAYIQSHKSAEDAAQRARLWAKATAKAESQGIGWDAFLAR